MVPAGEISGTCDERFAPVRDAFERNFADGAELGAAVTVVHRDEVVVDLWGGFADLARTKPWEHDTLVVVASTSKVVATIAGLMLVDRGLIELDEPVARYWPEFAAAGKEKITVRQIFCHTSGVAGFDPPTTEEVIWADWDAAVEQLSSQAPWWEPGTASGYHSWTYGYLIGELLRRTTGLTYDDFLRDELTGRIDPDFTIGVAPEKRSRVAELLVTEGRLFPEGPDSLAVRAESGASPPATGPMRELWMDGCNPSGGAFTTARAVARVGAVMANSGTYRGERFMAEETAALAWQEQRYEHDLVMGAPVRYGLGFGLASEEVPLPFPRSVHWGGFGGSTFVADPDSRTSWCYTPNRMLPDREGDARGSSIGGAAVASILGLA